MSEETIPAPLPRKLVTIQQASEIADVSTRTVFNWIKAGKVAFVRTAGGCVRIFADSLFKEPAQ